jgi:PAS domain S-box-containing protein
MKLWNLLWISLIVSEVMTSLMNTIMGLLWWGRIDLDLLLIGAIDAFIVALVASVILILIFNAMKEYERGAERALQEKNAQLLSLINTMPDMVIFKDVAGRHVVVNKAVEEVTGHRADEITGKTIEDLLPPDPAAACRKSDEAAMRRSEPTHAEEQIHRGDGSVSYFDMVKAPMVDDRGNVIGLVGVGRDITESKKAENALRESEEKFRALFENAKDGIWLISPNFDIVALNTSFAMMHGWTVEEMLKMNLLNLDTPESAALAPARMQRMFAGERMSFEVEHVCKNGQTIPLEVSANMVVIDNEKYILAFHRNIAERKKSEELIRSILDSVDEGFVIVDRDYRILSANKAYAKMVKRSIEDTIGRHCYEVSHHASAPCYLPGHACAVRQVFESGKPSTSGHVHRNEKGEPAYIETKAYPLAKDDAGAVVTAIETLVDVTEKHKLEDQLRQAQKMESIGTLAGGIAHDFNNILTAIVGYGSIALSKMSKDDPQRLNIEHMLEAGGRAAHLTKDLLLFSRKQISEKRSVDLNEIVRKTEKFLKRVIGEDIECRTTLSNEPLPIFGDAHQLEQVLMNLATNARDAMQTGGVFAITTQRVRINNELFVAHDYCKPGNYVLTTISDTGNGMDAVTREHIFEPFFTTKEVGKGTGLGLAVVYGIIKQHEGFLNVYSEPSRGTTFRIYLPLIPADVEEEKKLVEERPVGGTETILLAEDDESVRTMTRNLLENIGYKVITAIDGKDAVKTYKENYGKIHLLLFDIIMPKKTGKEAYDEIRAIQPGIKILFQSGYAPDIIHQKLLIDDKMPVVYKPVAPAELMNQVRSVLDG